jgi:hypothetical protein
MGQTFLSEGARAIHQAGDARKRVLVAGLYLVSSMERMAGRFVPAGETKGHGGSSEYYRFLLSDRVRYANKGLLPDARIAAWIARTGREAATLHVGAPGDRPIVLTTWGGPLLIFLRDAAKYHGDMDTCGTCAFRALQIAVKMLWEGQGVRRDDIRIESAHPSKGSWDLFEFVTRAATRGDLAVRLPAGTGRKAMGPDNWRFTVQRKSTGESVVIRLKASVFPGGPEAFFALRRKAGGKADPASRKSFLAAKAKMREAFLTRPAKDLFDVERKVKQEGR